MLISFLIVTGYKPEQLTNEVKYRLLNIENMKGADYRAGIFKQSLGARNRVGIGLLYRPARLHRLAEYIPWNRFLGSINV
jgi:hypothetical protein